MRENAIMKGLSGGFTDSHIRRHLNFCIVRETWGEYKNTRLVRRETVEDDRRRSSEIVSWPGGLGEERELGFFFTCLFVQ